MNNPYIIPLDTWQAHEQRHKLLHQACHNSYIHNEQVDLMREGYLHHLKQSCDNHPKWDKKEGWRP